MEEIPTRCPDPRAVQVRHGDVDHGREAKNVHGDRVPSHGSHASAAFSKPIPALTTKRFYIAQFFDELSQEWHSQLRLRDIDRLDHAGTRQLRPEAEPAARCAAHDAPTR